MNVYTVWFNDDDPLSDSQLVDIFYSEHGAERYVNTCLEDRMVNYDNVCIDTYDHPEEPTKYVSLTAGDTTVAWTITPWEIKD